MEEYDAWDLLTPVSPLRPAPSFPLEFEPYHFQYEPLDISRQEIRLVKMNPSKKHGSPRCNIETFDLTDEPPFKALSYTWGDPLPAFNISVGNGRLKIRENLFLFLSTYEDDGYLWVDQICIDQSNVDERNHQVGLMASIYSQCNCVIMWLGQVPRTLDARVVFNATKDLETLALLLQQEYLSRLWIVQEVLLAKELDVIFHHPRFGNISISWKSMCDIALQSAGALRVRGAPSSALSLLTQYGEVYVLSFEPIISTFTQGQCQDNRDKVDGLMGLVNEAERLPIDYRKSVHEVYSDVVVTLCISYKNNRQLFPFSDPDQLEDHYCICLLLGHRMGFTETQNRGLDNLLQSIWSYATVDGLVPDGVIGWSPVTAMGFNQPESEINGPYEKKEYYLDVTPEEEEEEEEEANEQFGSLKQSRDYWWCIRDGTRYRFYDQPPISQDHTEHNFDGHDIPVF